MSTLKLYAVGDYVSIRGMFTDQIASDVTEIVIVWRDQLTGEVVEFRLPEFVVWQCRKEPAKDDAALDVAGLWRKQFRL